jgi:putative peptide zinc metalloprotease protein
MTTATITAAAPAPSPTRRATALLPDELPLPPLRQELRLEPAAPSPEGIPRWRLYDPLQHRFFLIGEEDVMLLALWPCGSVGKLREALAQRVAATGDASLAEAELDEELLDGLLRFLHTHHLLQTSGKQAYQTLADQAKRLRGHGLRGVINRVLAMRLPVWSPHALIEYFIPTVNAIGHRSMLTVWTLLTLLGIYLTTRQWDQFIGTFSDFFSPSGMLAYGVALAGLKIVHELGHAYMATVRGVRVGNMGVSIFMGMPMLYTELGDVARLNDPRQRMWIAAGGVLAESFVAGLATLAWAVLPEGSLRSVAFVIATTSWLTSLLVNLNPLSRFDGYYFLADALRLDNLQPRALAFNHWLIGRLLLGPVEAPPEPVSRRRAALFMTYGTLSWCYQIMLSCGIAWLAYRTLFKTAGVLLLAYALWQFVGRRILRSVHHWWSLRDRVGRRRRLGLTIFGAALLLLCVLPLDRRVEIPAMVGWQSETPIQAPENARIEALPMRSYSQVKKGDLLVRFYSPELDSKRATAQLNLTIASERLDRIGGDNRDRAETTVLRQQQLQAEADLAGLAERARMLEWRAPQDGLLVDVPANLQVGQWVKPSTTLGRLLHGDALDAIGFVNEKELARLHPGAEGVFIADEPSLPRHHVSLRAIDNNASEFISPDSLSSRYGGPIATQPNDQGRSVPVVGQHRLNFDVNEGSPLGLPLRVRGEIQLAATPQSLAEQSIRRVWQLLVAELRE